MSLTLKIPSIEWWTHGKIPALYRVTKVVADLGWVDLDLVSSPGRWAATVATYYPSQMVQHPIYKQGWEVSRYSVDRALSMPFSDSRSVSKDTLLSLHVSKSATLSKIDTIHTVNINLNMYVEHSIFTI